MKSSSVLIVGCGDVGIRTGCCCWSRAGSVTGVRRNTAKLPAEFVGHAANYTQPGSLDFMARAATGFCAGNIQPG